MSEIIMKKRVIISFVFFIIGIIIYYLYDNVLNDNYIIFIRYYIPDLCWTISFYFMSINFTKNIIKRDLIFNSLYVLFFGILYELFQLYNIANGKFDVIDVLVYIISVIFANYIEIILRRNENEKNR